MFVVKSSDNQRLGASINLTPSFFDDLLNVSANVKGSYITNNYDGGPLGGAVSFNPTLPVHMNNVFGNYTTECRAEHFFLPVGVGSAEFLILS